MRPILPGATIGVLGSGQLGRMFAMAARRMGYRVHTYSPDNDTPTGQVSDVEWIGDYLDLDRVSEFARAVSVVTFEFENVPAPTAEVGGTIRAGAARRLHPAYNAASRSGENLPGERRSAADAVSRHPVLRGPAARNGRNRVSRGVEERRFRLRRQRTGRESSVRRTPIRHGRRCAWTRPFSRRSSISSARSR